MKGHMKLKRGLSKLFCFKVIVFIRFTQAWIFSLLLEEDIIQTSGQFSYNDIVWGIPGLCTCAEMVLFSLSFWYAFSSTEYGSKAKPGEAPMPLGSAILDASNPMDLIRGIGRIIPLWKELHRNGGWKQWRSAQVQTGAIGAARKRVQKVTAKRSRKHNRNGEYYEMPAPTARPADSHHGRADSAGTQDSAEFFQMRGFEGENWVHSPTNSPPDVASTHLVPAPSENYWNGQKYERSPSPGQIHGGTAIYERDMI